MQVWDKLYMSSNISQDRNQAIARIASGGVYKTRERIHRSILICDY